jgi:hypothetical protein
MSIPFIGTHCVMLPYLLYGVPAMMGDIQQVVVDKHRDNLLQRHVTIHTGNTTSLDGGLTFIAIETPRTAISVVGVKPMAMDH